jgi:aldehyde:ferredoxin oxidoreductase
MGMNISKMMPHPVSYELITGVKMNIGRFIKAGERGYNLERLVNLRQGLKGSEDTLPKRLIKEFQRSDAPDSKVKLEKMLKDYYKIRGWDKNGVPTEKRLRKLGLEGYHI